VYDRVKADNPTAKITEITKIISDMWQNVDQTTKDRLEAEYQKNKAVVAGEKAEYEEKYGKIERKKKKKRIDKGHKDEWCWDDLALKNLAGRGAPELNTAI
jgi:hypothetical protein